MSPIDRPQVIDHKYRDAFLLALLFAVAGPIIGGVIAFPFFFRISLQVIVDPRTYELIAVGSYIIGGIPAFLTGLLAAFGRLGGGVVPGSALAAVGTGWSIAIVGFAGPQWPVAVVAVSGAIAALICWYVGRRFLGPKGR